MSKIRFYIVQNQIKFLQYSAVLHFVIIRVIFFSLNTLYIFMYGLLIRIGVHDAV